MLTTPSQCCELAESSCPAAWHGGLRTRPTFQRHVALLYLDAASVHALLRAAGLPEAELRHMGAARAIFEPALMYLGAPQIAEEIAVPVLGRISWDRVFGAEGEMWRDCAACRAQARQLGQLVVRRWFR